MASHADPGYPEKTEAGLSTDPQQRPAEPGLEQNCPWSLVSGSWSMPLNLRVVFNKAISNLALRMFSTPDSHDSEDPLKNPA